MALSPQQIETRRSHIGGSDARTVLEGDGEAWARLRAEKIDGVQPVFAAKQMLLMEMGILLEPLTLREFNKKVPLSATAPVHIIWKDDPILAFSPDGITAEGLEPVQCKFHSGDQSILELAETYKAQLTHEMICADVRRMWLAVLFGHYGRFQHMEIRFDDALADQYLMRAMEFKEYLKTGVLPESMVGPIVEMKVEKKRDHVWPVGDNIVGPLCTALIDNQAQAMVFDEALLQMKKVIKKPEYADCASLTWRNEEGFGITFKLDARGAVRHNLAFPPRGKKAKAK